jgi:hypothetical protein
MVENMTSTSISFMADPRLLLDIAFILCAWSLMLLSIFRTIHRYRNPDCPAHRETEKQNTSVQGEPSAQT